MRKPGTNDTTVNGRCACLLLVAVIVVGLVLTPIPAVSQVTITGSSRQLTTGTANHYDPALSGNFVSYTSTQTGIPQVFYYDLTANTATQVSSGPGGADSSDVFGNTIVYIDYSTAAGGQVSGFRIGAGGGPLGPLAPNSSMAQSSPGIGGGISGGTISRRIVAWIANGGSATFDVFAKDLATGVVKQITMTAAVKSHPNVSGTSIVYASQTGAVSNILVTDFDTLVTRQLTTTGLNSSPDISGTHVVYQGVPADGNQDIFVFDLMTNVQTRISLPGVQRNPHVSGDWVAFEDVETGTSAIRLYYIPTGQLFSAVSSTTSNAFLNDIDGTRVAYTGDATGSEQIYLYSFTFTPEITVAIAIKPGSSPPVPINTRSQGLIPVAILSSATFDAPAMVDKKSLTFGRIGNEASLAFCDASGQDVNSDGLLDLVCHFFTQQTGFQAEDTIGVLKGKTVNGTLFRGTESVRIKQ